MGRESNWHAITDIRRAAEEQLAAVPRVSGGAGDATRLLYELQVHQIELEMQNDELRRARVELEESRDRYWALFDHAPFGYLALEPDGKIVEANLTASALLGIETARLVGRRISAFMDPPDADRFFVCRREAVAQGMKQSCELQLRRAGGRQVYVRLDVAPDRERPGGFLRAVIIDVTDLRQAQAEGRKNELRFLQIAERISDVFYIRPANGQITYVNQAFERIWGRPVEWLMGRENGWLETVDARDRDRVAEAWTRVRSGVPIDEVYRIARPDGTVRWVQSRASVVEGWDRPAVVGVVRDITNERLLEEELTHAQKMEAVGTLAGGVAHNLGNVLQTILVSIQLAVHAGIERPESVRVLQRGAQAAERGAALIRQLMAFARKQQREVLHRPVLLDDALRAAEPLVTALIGEEIRLEIAPGAPGVAVLADGVQLEQVLLNMASNARDAMPNGGRLKVTSRETVVDDVTAQRYGVAPGPFVTFAVQDTGCGMDAETKARVFEPFFTTKEAGKGTGLGLSTVFAIVREFGGYIEIDSQVGAGTTFRIALPCFRGSVPPG